MTPHGALWSNWACHYVLWGNVHRVQPPSCRTLLVKLVLQIFAGVLLASLVFWGGCALLVGAAAKVDQEQREKAVVAALQGMQRVAGEAQVASRNRQAAQAWKDVERQQALNLQPGQSCEGAFSGRPGSIVVRGVLNGVPQAVQLLENGKPVLCFGNQRLAAP